MSSHLLFLLGTFFLFIVLRVPVAFALGFIFAAYRCPAGAAFHVNRQPDVQRNQFFSSSCRTVFPVARQTHERWRDYRSSDEGVGRMGRTHQGRPGPCQRHGQYVVCRTFRILLRGYGRYWSHVDSRHEKSRFRRGLLRRVADRKSVV